MPIEVRNGYIKLQRLGPIKYTEQSRWMVRAPEKKGLWAFPVPYFDMFFAYHRYTDRLPKKLHLDKETGLPSDPRWYTDTNTGLTLTSSDQLEINDGDPADHIEFDDESFWEQREHWLKHVGKNVVRMSEFWYKGDLYSHFLPNGDIGRVPGSSRDPDVDWTRMGVSDLAKMIKATRGDEMFYRWGETLTKIRTSKDHLEVFIAPGMGQIRSSPK